MRIRVMSEEKYQEERFAYDKNCRRQQAMRFVFLLRVKKGDRCLFFENNVIMLTFPKKKGTCPLFSPGHHCEVIENYAALDANWRNLAV